MIYCIGNNLGKKIPGIEHSQIKRINLFSQLGEKAKIVTLAYNSALYENAELFLIADNIFSMYDYFQESVGNNVYSREDYHRKWQNNSNYHIEYVPNTTDIKVFYQEEYICYAHFFDNRYQRVSYINYFDGPYETRRKVKREIYDARGFLSNVKILGEKQQVLTESYYSPSGEEKIICYYNFKQELSRIQLLNYKNESFYFKNKNDWQAFFLDEINQEDVLFFSDRTQSVIESVTLMKTKAKLIPVIHNVHLRAPFEPKTSEITSPYQELFNQLDYTTALVASTTHQAEELNQRLPENVKAYPIPVGYIKEIKQVTFKKRNPYKLICMARYYSEKQLLHQIKIVEELLPKFPKLELHLFGYGDATDNFKEEKMLKSYVKKNQLEKHVFFRGYLTDLESEYNNAGAMLLTSSIEGFCLSLLEAVEHGVPVISYDIRYGPSEIIEDGKNGYLIKKNDNTQMKEKLDKLLSHPELQNEMSNNAYEVAKKFNQENIKKKWQQLLENEKGLTK
ncbi:glycosyltransferase [Vagococcus carniphilus]|nr:glycosyltransferase [Vagococcus carniphilus]MDT2829817.1 glycosyltransferase [Vagococcus carniphilus]MDT2838251.1 glycosyltransferase [Vagococcus carniphilus]MDT2854247.1 glycosyltransferase [Vagococcus carniphilus]